MASAKYHHYPAASLRLKPDVPGARYFAVALEHAMLTYFEVAPGSVFEEHQHPSEQITLVLSGKLLFRIDGEDVLVGPLEAIAVPANVPHAVSSLDLPVKAVDAWSPPRDSFETALPGPSQDPPAGPADSSGEAGKS